MENSYLSFVKQNGRQLSEINPGSEEIALDIKNALKALELLKENQIAVLGGDILTEENDELIYAYQLWGGEYQYLNWYCDQNPNESDEEYLQRSYAKSIEGISDAVKIADKFRAKCYIVFVTA
ncbi:Imm40 family immunity protein [Rurimicrobium arvi]|uniref:Immunity protein 40 domain-containing protein n=1 Tax=Rurimicrobium arvi TaxID=2049916 RepID=A0ABP8MV46_9BACT